MQVSVFRVFLIFLLLTVLLCGGTLGFHIIEGAGWFDSFYMGVIVLAIQKPSARMSFNPSAEARIESGDYLIAMGESAALRGMESQLA